MLRFGRVRDGDNPSIPACLGRQRAKHALGVQRQDLLSLLIVAQYTLHPGGPFVIGHIERIVTSVKYAKAVYKPMRELLAYLEANGFRNFICSGSPVLFTRALSEEMFGIPPERVMGSNAGTKLDERAGKTVLVFDGDIDHINDKEGKPPTINLALGLRPVFVGGNEGGRGDIAMMRWSKDRDGPSFQLLINHDDAEREFAYSEPDNYSLRAAAHYGFNVVNMKEDWKEIVAREP